MEKICFTVLGSGSSGGVPRIGGHWGACDPKNSKNRRRRCSLLIEKTINDKTTTILVDTSPDLREQLLSEDVTRLDGVLYTHFHADQTHGINDLRIFYIKNKKKIPVYCDKLTSEYLINNFSYCFINKYDYPPMLQLKTLKKKFYLGNQKKKN